MRLNYNEHLEGLEVEASERLNKGEQISAIKADMIQQTKERFPNERGIGWAVQEAIRAALAKLPAGTQVTIHNLNVGVIQDSPAAELTFAPPSQPAQPATQPAAKPQTRKLVKLNFRLIKEDSLTLTDRIVFSYLWKWSGKPYSKTVSISRMRKATGFRHEIVKASFTKLESLGLICDRKPQRGDSRLMRGASGKPLYRHLEWEENDLCLRFNVFRAVMATNRCDYYSGWWRKALGLSRRTLSGWKALLR